MLTDLAVMTDLKLWRPKKTFWQNQKFQTRSLSAETVFMLNERFVAVSKGSFHSQYEEEELLKATKKLSRCINHQVTKINLTRFFFKNSIWTLTFWQEMFLVSEFPLELNSVKIKMCTGTVTTCDQVFIVKEVFKKGTFTYFQVCTFKKR